MTGGSLSLTAHVGDTIVLPANGTHPLYFDNGSTSCLVVGGVTVSGTTSGPITYVFPAAATYYFHCGNHARTCSATACGSTDCTAMAGTVTVN